MRWRHIALSARVVAYEYNPLLRHYISVELGSTARRFTSVTGQVKSAMSAASQASDAAGFALASADGKNTNDYGTTQPEKAHLGDTWFKSSGETTEIWIYRVTDTGQPGWVALATDLNHAQISAELDAARREVEDVKAQTIRVDSAMSMLSGRLEEANTALMQARSDAQAARDTAAEVNQFATKIATVVDQHTTDLQAVKDVAQRAQLTATQVEDTAKQIDTKLKQASTEIAQTKQAVTQASTDISNAHKRADDAYALASGRPSTAQVNTLIAASANTKNTITYSSNLPSGFGSRIGDTWWQQTGDELRDQWQWDGKTWVQRKLRHEIIASVDTAILVAGSARMGKAVVERIVGDAAFFGVLAANRIVVGDGTNLWGYPNFYASYIRSRSDWQFAGMYSDEGISGTSMKRREGFQTMIADALAGKIDLILTKSVSRFARNTVDTLTHVRSLKDAGVEVYFEKENIWTFDSKGELLITIMSSLA